MKNSVKELKDLLPSNEPQPDLNWRIWAISSGECQSYILAHQGEREFIIVDPKREDYDAYQQIIHSLSGFLCLGIFDTHTHADHVSVAARLTEELRAPLYMHQLSGSQRVHLRIQKETRLPSHAGPISVFHSPGHTPDGITVVWGPFAFTGDTLLYGDVGRDDLPGGDPASHFESVEKYKQIFSVHTLILPGHDNKGGRISSWATQLKVNPSLTQEREVFIQECAAFIAPAPLHFKEALVENLK